MRFINAVVFFSRRYRGYSHLTSQTPN